MISAVSFQIKTRARELAVLQSVGMTSESLEKMLNTESILCSGKALAIGLPVGMLIVMVIGYCVKWFFHQIPYALGCGADHCCSVFGVIWGTVKVSLSTLKNRTL